MMMLVQKQKPQRNFAAAVETPVRETFSDVEFLMKKMTLKKASATTSHIMTGLIMLMSITV